MPNTAQFVKFVKGTPTAFEALTTKDANTLYFISEENATTGSLYLGSKLLSGSVSDSDLGEVIISSVSAGDLLVYDDAQEAWVNKSVNEAIGIMTGATANANGVSGLVPIPTAGNQDKFLRGDGTWSAVDFTAVNTSISGLETRVGSLETSLSSKVSRQIVESTSSVTSPQENVIYMVDNGSSEGNKYDEYMYISNNWELIGSGNGTISGYVTTTTFNTKVGELESSIDTINTTLNAIPTTYVSLTKYGNEIGDFSELVQSTENNTVIDQVNELTSRLTWNILQ